MKLLLAAGGNFMSRILLMMKEIGGSRQNKAVLKTGITVFVILAMAISLFLFSYSEDVNKGLANNLIRLHVIANSDSSADQNLKKDVRDIIINYMEDELKSSKDAGQTEYIIKNNIQNIERIAKDEINRRGRDYNVRATLGSYPFPTKAYGDITLPAGYYQALKVVIGKGEGDNWWCVLFPPLCFVDVTHGTLPDDVKENLKNALTSEEYNIIASAGDDSEIPVKIRFKIVEFFQDSRIRFTGIISRIFKSKK